MDNAVDPTPRAEWESAAAAVLRKAGRLCADDPDSDVWGKLARTTYDGITIPPLGTPELTADLTTHGRPSRQGDWDVRVTNSGNNEHAVADLETGATSLWLDTDDIGAALQGVLLDLAPVVVEAGTIERATSLIQSAAGTQLHRDTNLGADPIGQGLRSAAATDAVAMANLALRNGIRAIVVDATAVHDLGASDAQEIGYSLAAGVAYLRLLTDAGIDLDDAAALIDFRYAATDEQFPTIAKLRAARRCWARVLELSGGVGEQRQHAVTSRPMMSKYDPYVNLLRGTVAAFAAGVGGAEAVTVLPFDSPLGESDDFGRRIARNVSSLLLAESHVGAVADPAGGAFAVEKLTDDLALAGWAEFGRIEESGGVEAAIADGSWRARIDEVVVRRSSDIAKRRKPITGLTEFPNLQETLPSRPFKQDDVRRYGADFESLRDDPRGNVWLATMGPISAHTARATFATNLFAAGGIDVTTPGALAGVDEAVAAFGGQSVVCLCGTDQAYAEWGAELIAALRAAGARHVIIAGQAGDLDVNDNCAMGVDALAFLHRTREEF